MHAIFYLRLIPLSFSFGNRLLFRPRRTWTTDLTELTSLSSRLILICSVSLFQQVSREEVFQMKIQCLTHISESRLNEFSNKFESSYWSWQQLSLTRDLSALCRAVYATKFSVQTKQYYPGIWKWDYEHILSTFDCRRVYSFTLSLKGSESNSV